MKILRELQGSPYHLKMLREMGFVSKGLVKLHRVDALHERNCDCRGDKLKCKFVLGCVGGYIEEVARCKHGKVFRCCEAFGRCAHRCMFCSENVEKKRSDFLYGIDSPYDGIINGICDTCGMGEDSMLFRDLETMSWQYYCVSKVHA